MFTKFQDDVVLELVEMHKLGLVQDLAKAQTFVWQNQDNTFSEESGMSVSEAASLVVELSRSKHLKSLTDRQL